ncbi:MAG: hypothetical protein Q4E61_03725, partial [Alphaproteobacteria bacterium]|nr:hypothetical protein [Alphaproteobacteria bacterium]
FLAKRKYITGKKKFYPEYAKRNLNIFEKQPEIIALKNSIDKKINKLYPKTKLLRQYIINHDRVLLDRIEKIKKYTIKDKLILSLKRLIG